MNLNKIEKWATIFVVSIGIFVSVLLVETIILAFFSQFRAPFIHLSLIPASVATILFSIQIKKDIKLLPKITSPVLLLILLIALILIFYPHDTFGGRDESIYSNYAMHLTQKASLNFPSYLNNLPNNFVEDVRFTSPGYIVWLAIQSNFFGVQGLLRGNLVIIILGLSSFFLVASYFGGNKMGLISTTLFSSSMPFLWFSRETMSENLSFFLLWSIILFLLFYLKTKRFVYILATFICGWLFGFTRFEGFLLQFVLLFTLFLLLFLNKINFKKIFVITTIGTLVLISNIYINKDTFIPIFLKVYIPQVTVNIKRDVSSLIPKNLSNNKIKYSSTDISNQPKYKNLPLFIFLMMAKYNFILVIFSIFLITVQSLFRIKKFDKAKKFFFIILILLIPEYYKLISPNVTIDQPWLYRRYMYALLPFGYLCLSLFFSQFKHKKPSMIILLVFFIINIYLSKNILFLKNNWLLVGKIEKLATDISQNDFVIIKGRPLKDYSSHSFLRLQKGIRSAQEYTVTTTNFFPEKKIFGGVPYNKIFLLSANDKDSYPSFNAVLRKSVDAEYAQLVRSCELNLLGEEEQLADSHNVGALSFSNVEKYCSQPKNEIIKHEEKIYLYELVYKNEKS